MASTLNSWHQLKALMACAGWFPSCRIQDLLAAALHTEGNAVASALLHDPYLVPGNRVHTAVAVPLQLDPGVPQKVPELLEPFHRMHGYGVVLEEYPQGICFPEGGQFCYLLHHIHGRAESDSASVYHVGAWLAVYALEGTSPAGHHAVLGHSMGQVGIVVNHIPCREGNAVYLAVDLSSGILNQLSPGIEIGQVLHGEMVLSPVKPVRQLDDGFLGLTHQCAVRTGLFNGMPGKNARVGTPHNEEGIGNHCPEVFQNEGSPFQLCGGGYGHGNDAASAGKVVQLA